jgi:hypothetical protein
VIALSVRGLSKTFGGAETATVLCPDKERAYFIIQSLAKSAK